MLEHSNLIEGQKAREVNKLIAEYEDITAKLADLDKSKKEVLTKLFELAEVGTNETNKFIFNVVNNSGRATISVKNLSEQAPDLFGKVSALGLISVGENFKTVRSIKLKGDRV